jgi:hypothetical protein
MCGGRHAVRLTDAIVVPQPALGAGNMKSFLDDELAEHRQLSTDKVGSPLHSVPPSHSVITPTHPPSCLPAHQNKSISQLEASS